MSDPNNLPHPRISKTLSNNVPPAFPPRASIGDPTQPTQDDVIDPQQVYNTVMNWHDGMGQEVSLPEMSLGTVPDPQDDASNRV